LGGYLWRVGGGSLAINYTDQIWRYSGSGAQMTSDTAEFLGRIGHGLISYGNKLWLIGGTQTHMNDFSQNQLKNDVWSSEDGETWVLRDAHAPFSARVGHACAVFRNRLWVLGGADFEAGVFHNDIWYLEGN
jgi:N-acetylneuraminic acid mutarotase